MALGSEIVKRIKPDEHYAVAIWCTDDVHAVAAKLGIVLTDEEAEEIIDTIDRRQDAEIGINWDVLLEYVTDVRKEKSG